MSPLVQDYDTMLQTFKSEIHEQEKFKRDFIRKLALQIDKEKIVETHKINDKLAKDLEGYVTRGYVGQCLDNEFKYKTKQNNMKEEDDKEELVEVTTDGRTIIPDKKQERDKKKKQLEELERADFSKDLSKALDARAQDSTTLNTVVVRELEEQRNENQDLRSQLKNVVTREEFETLQKKLAAQEEIMEYIEENLGSYLRFEKEGGKIVCAEINELMKSEPPKEITIDLRRFEDEIRESFKRGKYIAKIVQKDGQVKSWT